jgi:flagellin-like hook-associated protein FlgL
MTTINRTLFPVQTGANQIAKLQARFNTLQVQLATGLKATNLAELGSDRYFDLSVRNRLGRIEGYQNNIDTLNLRLDVFDNVLSRLDAIEGDARVSMVPGGYGSSNINFGTAPSLAQSRLDEVLNLLNTDVDGRYLFGGNVSDKKPVKALDAILNGVAGKAGFKQVAAERAAADLGGGLGRLTLGVATDTATLTEDGDHPFGFKLSTLTSTSGAVTLTAPAGTAPQNLSVKFDAQPIEGESITIGLTLPDGSEEGITLKAVTGTPGKGEFQIGANVDETAGNFGAALGTALTDMGQTKLAAASAFAAADNFFNGQGSPVLRVVGPPATATSLAAADPATTVIWYSGGDDANARQTVGSKIDETTSVAYGVQANESGLVQVVRSLAAVAIQSFPEADPTSKGRFDAIATRNIDRLAESHNSESGSIEMIAVELGNTKAAAGAVSKRHTDYGAQLEQMLSDIETVPKEDVAMELLALQTRLHASYEATSLIAQLSMVNYLK